MRKKYIIDEVDLGLILAHPIRNSTHFRWLAFNKEI